MPIYVYGCRKCGAVEEHIQRFSDPPLTRCEACGGKLEKKVTSAAFHLKGGGWYRDGYASARPDGGGGSDAGEAATSAKSEGGGEASGSTSDAAATSGSGAPKTSTGSSGKTSKTSSKSSKKKTKATA